MTTKAPALADLLFYTAGLALSVFLAGCFVISVFIAPLMGAGQ